MLPIAILLGIMAGYFRGWIDDIIQYVYTTLNSIPGRAADRRRDPDAAGLHGQPCRQVRKPDHARRHAAALSVHHLGDDQLDRVCAACCAARR